LQIGVVLAEEEPMTIEFTAVFLPQDNGYVAFVEELPGANTQGDTLEEARENLRDAISMILDENRDQARSAVPSASPVIRESIAITRF
jgi:predicted RNase H-like HicB family nuclease